MRKNLKRFLAALFVIAICLTNINGFEAIQEVKAADTSSVTVKNYDFESAKKNSSGKWEADDWEKNDHAEVVLSGGINNSKCLKITNDTYEYHATTQTLQLEPNTEYMLTGYIKGENIVGKMDGNREVGDGATIDFDENTAYMVEHINNWKTGTFDWTKVTVYFISPSKGDVKIRCRLGHYWGNAKGTAYFDNIKIEKKAFPNDSSVNRVKVKNKNVGGYITKNIVNKIGMDKYQSWLNEMQEAYEAYMDLTGSCPYNGDVLNIINTDEPMIQQYVAIGNFNPLLHNRDIMNSFTDYANHGYISFADLHEMGHAFDNVKENNTETYGWDFDDEFWANTKMLYVFDATNISTFMGDKERKNSAEMMEYYKTVGGGYDDTIAKGKFAIDGNGDALTYVFIKIIQKIGWEPFKTTFRQYVNKEISTPDTNFAKLDKYLYILQQNYNPEGNEVMDCIGNTDYEIIRNGMKNSTDDKMDKTKQQYMADIKEKINAGNYQENIITIMKQASRDIEHAGSETEAKQYYNSLNTTLSKIKSVTFKNFDGTVLKKEQVIEGEAATPPTATKRGYTFIGWDKSYTNIRTDMVLTAQFRATENKVVIYYKGFENAYIHYQIGSGAWTVVPGMKMEPCTDLAGFNYKAEVSLGTADKLTCCFNNGNGTWDNNSTSNYTFKAGYYTFTASASSENRIKEIEAPVLSTKITSLTTNYPNGLTISSDVTITAEVSNAKPGTTYSYYAIINGSAAAIAKDTTNLSVNWHPNAVGTYTLKAEAKYNGQIVADKTTSIVVNERMSLSSPTGNTTIYKGKEATFNLSATGGTGKITYTYAYTKSWSQTKIILQSSTNPTLKWTPSESGYYQLWYEASDEGGYHAPGGYITVNVEEAAENKVVIYYKGFENAYIHYQIGSGAWTVVPGMKMEPSTDLEGFDYKAEVCLGTEDKLTCCFNDGNGTWDNNSTRNYTFMAGYYTCKNGVITQIEKPEKKLTVTSLVSKYPKGITGLRSTELTATVANAQGSVKYTFTDTDANGTVKTIVSKTTNSKIYWLPSSYGEHVITVIAEDSISTATKTMNITVNENITVTFAGEQTVYVGDSAKFSMSATGGTGVITYNFYYTQWPDNTKIQLQSSTNNTLIWYPENTGTYQLYYKVSDEGGESKEVGYKEVKVQERPYEENKVVIYYSGFNNPKMHYQIGDGPWTADFGVFMQQSDDVDGFKYMLEIHLGTADELTACFNDGNGTWDNNGGNNYKFKAGYYTLKNGIITKLK